MKTLLNTLWIWPALALIGCGSGGGGSNAPGSSSTNALFVRDMDLLGKSETFKATTTNPGMDNAFVKAFGGSLPGDVKKFIEERVKHVYSVDEILNFRLDVRDRGKTSSFTLRQVVDSGDLGGNGSYKVTGINFGTGIATVKHEQNFEDVSIYLPTGKTSVTSSRVGLVGLTANYSVMPTNSNSNHPPLAIPLEGRVSTLVHEGRHSDCPDGYDASNCGYGHRECADGDLAGLAACDNHFWGPYAMGGIYLHGVIGNYPFGSQEARILQFLADDDFSRLTSEQREALLTSDPDLSSL